VSPCESVRVCECYQLSSRENCDLLSPLHSTRNQGRSATATRVGGTTVGCRCGFSLWRAAMGRPISANGAIIDVWQTGRARTERS